MMTQTANEKDVHNRLRDWISEIIEPYPYDMDVSSRMLGIFTSCTGVEATEKQFERALLDAGCKRLCGHGAGAQIFKVRLRRERL